MKIVSRKCANSVKNKRVFLICNQIGILMNVKVIIKITLITLIFLCLLDMPYGYFQFVRFAALVCFGVLAYQAHEQNNQKAMVIYAALALLFQPFFKIALGRELWNIVDVVVGLGLLISVFKTKSNRETRMENRSQL